MYKMNHFFRILHMFPDINIACGSILALIQKMIIQMIYGIHYNKYKMFKKCLKVHTIYHRKVKFMYNHTYYFTFEYKLYEPLIVS